MSNIGLESGYSRRSLARLALSVAAAELADHARALVPTNADAHAEPGEFLEHAQQLLAAAQSLVQRAAVLERERGASWDVLGERLEISKQAAQQRFAATLENWRSALDEPLVPTGRNQVVYDCRLPDGPDDPERHAQRLDAWLAHHQEPDAQRSVSEGLQRATLVERVAELTRQARFVVHEPDPAKHRAFQERKAAVLTAIAEARPGDADAAAAAVAARDALTSPRG
jgi:hypothetical protein